MLKHRPAQISNHEELFVQRYKWLMDWAIRLTENDREQATDLVHDAFVHFIISRPALDRIQQNIDGYLYTMLKNLHLSELRRVSRLREVATPAFEFCLTDYDSLESGLKVLEELTNAQIQSQIRDQLRRLCHYASIRKNSSKAGSVLLLRFFHGYYPEEIARILRTSREAVEGRLRSARNEARVFLNDPGSLRFMSEHIPAFPPQTNRRASPEDFMDELRRQIYRSRTGECLSPKEIEQLYTTSAIGSVDQQTVSHLVSCADCLDRVNQVLGLPVLKDRLPISTMSKDTRKKGKDDDDGSGGASSGGGTEDLLKKARKKAQELVKQRPLELRVSINGFILGSQGITSRVNRQTISVKGEEPIRFVEVFNEKESRLLFSCVEPPPDGPIEHKEIVVLSDGRSLELILDFSNAAPDIHVIYTDPKLGWDPSAESIDAEESQSQDSYSTNSKDQNKSRTVELLKQVINTARSLLKSSQFWFKPATVTVVVSLTLIFALMWVYRRPPALGITVEDLLRSSAKADEAIASASGHVIHRTLQLEEKSSSGHLITRKRLEIWQSIERGIVARRLYDENSSLLAGDWRTPNGVQTLYHHGTKPQLQLTPTKRSGQLSINFETVWQLDLAAKDFSLLIGSANKARVEEGPKSYVITYQAQDSAASLMSASLVVNRADLHPVEQELVVRRGVEVREYRFTETAFERRASNAVVPSVFEPDAELLSLKEPVPKTIKPEEILSSVTSQPATSAVATPELELQAAYLLDQVRANLGEQVTLTRSRNGILRVEGIVETAERKTQILKALAPLANNPAVSIDLDTTEEASKRKQQQSTSSSVTVDRIEITKSNIPLDAALREYFAAKGISPDRFDEEVRQFGDRMIASARRAQMHARVLKSLFERFTADELSSLDVDARNKHTAMIRAHADAFRLETARLRQEIEAVFFPSSPVTREDTFEIGSEAELRRAVERLFELGAAHENAMYSSFSISSDGAATSLVRTPQFWQSLKSSEKLAAEIAAWTKNSRQ